MVGDCVAIGRTKPPHAKMYDNWVSPRRIVEVLSRFIYGVQHLLTEETENLHVSVEYLILSYRLGIQTK